MSLKKNENLKNNADKNGKQLFRIIKARYLYCLQKIVSRKIYLNTSYRPGESL